MLVADIYCLEQFLLVTMYTAVLVFALLLNIASAAESCEGRLDAMEERVDSLAKSVDEILQTVQKGMSLLTIMSLVGNTEVEDKSRREKEEISERYDDLNAENGNHLLPVMNDTNLEERVGGGGAFRISDGERSRRRCGIRRWFVGSG